MECIIVSTADIKKRKTLAVCMFNLLSLKKASKAELWNTFKAHINMWDRLLHHVKSPLLLGSSSNCDS